MLLTRSMMAQDAKNTAFISTGLLFLIFVEAVFVLCSVAVLYLRYSRLKPARTFTKILNIALLIKPLSGTALGIYGLLKVDKPPNH